MQGAAPVCEKWVVMLNILHKLNKSRCHVFLLRNHGHRGFGGFKGESARFEFLDLVEHRHDFIAFHFSNPPVVAKYLARISSAVSG